MHKIREIVVINLMAVALAACGNSGGGNEAQVQAVSADPSAATAAVLVVEPTQENLPGTYGGTLPCGDCKGVVTKLELLADGSYKINEIFDGRSDNAVLDSNGKWAFDPDSRRVTLDPTAQDWQDRVFETLVTGALRPLDGNGTPYSSEGVNDLRVNE